MTLSIEEAKLISGRLMEALLLKIGNEEKVNIENGIITCLVQGTPLSKRNLSFCAGEHSASTSTWFRVARKLKIILTKRQHIFRVGDN